MKRGIKRMINALGYAVHRLPPAVDALTGDRLSLPDRECYRPLFSPWLGEGSGDFQACLTLARPFTLVSPDRLYVLYSLARQATALPGVWYECGVYRGGSAMMLSRLLAGSDDPPGRELHLFDTFEGMPETDARRDIHRKGDFADTSLEGVRARVGGSSPGPGRVMYHRGVIPETFAGLEDHSIALSHIDIDIYNSIIDSCEFIYPRMEAGGFMVFDDYGFPSCPGARAAVDEFFADKPEVPLVLPTGQAIVFLLRPGNEAA